MRIGREGCQQLYPNPFFFLEKKLLYLQPEVQEGDIPALTGHDARIGLGMDFLSFPTSGLILFPSVEGRQKHKLASLFRTWAYDGNLNSIVITL